MMKSRMMMTCCVGLFLLLTIVPVATHATVPQQINYQGILADSDGNPVPDGDYDMLFKIYNTPTEGTPLWSQDQTVTVTNGIYNVILGQEGNELDPDDFDGNLYLGVQVGTDLEMTPRQKITATAFSLKAAKADSVADGAITSVMIANGAVDTEKVASNAITSAKIVDGTVTADDIYDGSGSGLDADRVDGHEASHFATAAYVASLEARIAVLENLLLQHFSRNGNDITISGANVHIVNGSGTTNGTPNGLGNLIVGYNEIRGTGNDRSGSHNIVVGMEHNYSSHSGLVVGFHNQIAGEYACVSGGAYNTATSYASSVSGGISNTANNSCSSVSGGSWNVASGERSSVSGGDNNKATGQYSIVGGGRNNMASGDSSSVVGGGGASASDGNEAFGHYASILGGAGNISGDPAKLDHNIGQQSTISGGLENKASGQHASVSGGWNNTASGTEASVSGGRTNTASGTRSSISGGYLNQTTGSFACVSGGWINKATSSGDSVSGGYENTASGSSSSVSGGWSNTASGSASSISGGRWNNASGEASFIGGGGGEYESNGNQAFADYSAVLGGYNNIAGDPDLISHDVGERSVVSGGVSNTASGIGSSVSGGVSNTASGSRSTVSGGQGNTATGLYSSILGGWQNNATAWDSTISGGSFNTASGDQSSVSGGNNNTAAGSDSTVSGGKDGSVDRMYNWMAGELFQEM